MSLICRHGRFTADCPICSKGTVLEGERRPARRSASSGGRAPRPDKREAAAFAGPHVSAGPYEDEQGVRYEVRLERVPGGARLAEWAGSQLRRRAPILDAGDLVALAARAGEILTETDAGRLGEALAAEPDADPGGAGVSRGGAGVSRGRAGDFKEELRVEPLPEGRARVGRWVMRPGSGWELKDAPPMLPAARYAEALADAVRRGVLAASGAGERARL